MLFDLITNSVKPSRNQEFLDVNGRRIPLAVIRHPRARRYVLRLSPDGSARVTIPRGGSISEAHAFAARHSGWLEKQWQRLIARPPRPREWLLGTELLLRGELVKIEPSASGDTGQVRFGDQSVKVLDPTADLRRAITEHLWDLAARELPPRVLEFAALHELSVRRITVRDQKSRWGSCSRRGTISLNWRLIQTPPFVRDYIVLHELMHLRQMNHSAQFWREVERACPDYDKAERWLKRHSSLLK